MYINFDKMAVLQKVDLRTQSELRRTLICSQIKLRKLANQFLFKNESMLSPNYFF